MSSNIRINRICEYCKNEYVAKTTVSKTCSERCAKMNYKVKQRAAKIEQSNAETQEIKERPLAEIKAKEYLTVRDVAKLLSCSVRTAYRLINNGNIKAVNISQRKTLVKRSDIDSLFAS